MAFAAPASVSVWFEQPIGVVKPTRNVHPRFIGEP
jgi:hypothetical protein